jgi:arylsulfatase
MHIILYVMDALRVDHVSCHGYTRRTTTNFDLLANDGILFQNAFAPATWTRPVAASLLTGVYPLVHKVRQRNHVLGEAIPRLPVELGDQGWYTVAFSAMSNVSTATGFATGFDHFFDLYLDAELIEKTFP